VPLELGVRYVFQARLEQASYFAPLEQPTLIGMNIWLFFNEMWLGFFKPVIDSDYLIVGHAVDSFAPRGVWIYALDVFSFFARVHPKNSGSGRSSK
jgi:hypothetical protein